MKVFIGFILLVTIAWEGKAQGFDLQGVHSQLQNASDDSTKFDLYTKLFNEYSQTNIDSSLYYIDVLISLARKNNKKLEEAKCLASKAFQHMNSRQYVQALEYYLEAFEIAENPEIEKNYWTLRENNSPRNERMHLLTNVHFTFGYLMGLTGDMEEQLNQYRKTKKLAQENNDRYNLAYANDGLALVYIKKNQLDSALFSVNTSIKILSALDYKFNESYGKWILGSILMEKREYDKAYPAFRDGQVSAKRENNRLGLLINEFGLSNYYLQKGVIDSSLYYAYKIENQAGNIDFHALDFDIGKVYENIYQIHKFTNDKDNALHYLQKAKTSRDSLNGIKIKNLSAFQQVLMRLKLEQKDEEKERASIQNRNRIYALMLILFVILVISFMLYRNNLMKQKANKILSDTLSELKNTQDQLIHVEKMASLGELTAGIAHEIQNPLNFVNNFSEVSSELIKEAIEELNQVKTQYTTSRQIDPSKIEEVEAILNDLDGNQQKINHHGKRADSIVKGMLLHSRKSTGQKEMVDINALADEYLRLAYHGFRAKEKSFQAEFKSDFEKDLPAVKVVPQDIGRVLLNLINNAFYAVHLQSKIFRSDQNQANSLSEVKNQESIYKPSVTVTTRKVEGIKGQMIRIFIKDNGHGIPDEVKSKIFQPFYTTKPTGLGTGLGLSISYDIIKAHGGDMEVESKVNEGTNFIVTIPI